MAEGGGGGPRDGTNDRRWLLCWYRIGFLSSVVSGEGQSGWGGLITMTTLSNSLEGGEHVRGGVSAAQVGSRQSGQVSPDAAGCPHKQSRARFTQVAPDSRAEPSSLFCFRIRRRQEFSLGWPEEAELVTHSGGGNEWTPEITA